MLTIRFQRTGKRNRPEFRVVVAPKTAAAQKKFTEILGNYNPRTKELVIKNQDRLQYWLAQRLEISASVQNLFVTKKLLDASKVKAFALPKKAAPAPEAVPTAPAPETPAAEEAAPAETPATEAAPAQE